MSSNLVSKFQTAWTRFWFRPASAKPIAALRIGLGAVLLTQLYLLRGIGFELLSRDGIVQGILADQMSLTVLPRIGGIAASLSFLDFSETTWITLVTLIYASALVMMTAGLFTRTSTVVAWFFHWTLMNTAFSTSYGVDLFAHVFLFYLIFMPAKNVWSLDCYLHPQLPKVSIDARLSLRVLQLHLCIMYFASGIEKSMGPQWWNGELMWRALTLPVYRQFNFEWLADWPHLSQVIGISTLSVEIGYCVLIWPKLTRRIWVPAIVSMHLGIAIFLGLPLFGIIMAILTASVFGIPSEPASEFDSFQIDSV